MLTIRQTCTEKKLSTNRETPWVDCDFPRNRTLWARRRLRKIRFSTVSVVVCIPESQKKRLRRYKKILEKLHYIELLWLHFRIEIWQPPLTQVRPNIFTSACALTRELWGGTHTHKKNKLNITDRNFEIMFLNFLGGFAPEPPSTFIFSEEIKFIFVCCFRRGGTHTLR